MGNDNAIKDPNIQIFLELKTLVLKSGQILKGCIYLEVIEYSPYSELALTLECFEKTELRHQKDKNGEILTEQRKTYFDTMKIAEFLNGLYQGQHQFPFKIKLPEDLPGTLVLSPNNYIRYRLTAYLQSTSPIFTNQLKSREICLIEKFRSPIRPIFSQELKEPKCCMFGYSWGWIKTQLQCEFNCITPGQKVKIKFQINTNRMNTSVKHTKVRIVEKTFSATHQFAQENQISELFSFDFNEASIEKRQIKKMQKSIVFSVDLMPTVIGQILSRFYVIEIDLLFACYSSIKQRVHIFVASEKNLIKEENKQFLRPKGWQPHKYEAIEFSKLKKYEHKRHQKLPFENVFPEQTNRLQAMQLTQPADSERQIK